jgi:hypothetical protein
MTTFAIIGSGFGLYGYLPALAAEYKGRIALPERYRQRFFSRPELAPYEERVRWVKDEETALGCAEGVVLTLPPTEQAKWVRRCFAHSNVVRLLLEKPLAPSPDDGGRLLENLHSSDKVFRIGYIFRYTAWGKLLLDALSSKRGSGRRLSMHWTFLAHHYRHDLNSWKRFSVEGGGAIRFYGIHVIALLAEAGYSQVATSFAPTQAGGEVERWTATFAGTGLPECHVLVDTRSPMNRFLVQETASDGRTGLDVSLSNPFEASRQTEDLNGQDERVPVLRKLCRSLWDRQRDQNGWYDATIALWRRVETQTRYEPTSCDEASRAASPREGGFPD